MGKRGEASDWRNEDRGFTSLCRIWQGAKSGDGYGYRRHEGRVQLVHIIEWEAKHGPVPAGCELDHRCRQRPCGRVDHLEAVTHVENVRRGVGTRLSAEAVRAIRARAPRGSTRALRASVAAEFGTTEAYVRELAAGRRGIV